MPKQKRWAIIRSLAQAWSACDKAQKNLVETGRQYEGIHPEYYDAFAAIVTGLELIKKTIADLSGQI